MFYRQELKFLPNEIIIYLRKSRSDDPSLSVEEVLEKHELQLGEWAEKNLDSPVPEQNIFREIVSGETIDARPELQKILTLIESPKIKAILVVDEQRLSRGDLEDAGRLIKILRYSNTYVITPHFTYDLSDKRDRENFEHELKRGNDYLEYYKMIQDRGRLLSVQQGNYLGSIPPYGYNKATVVVDKRKCPTLEENPEEANAVRMIFDLFVNKNLGYMEIAKELNRLGIKPRNGTLWHGNSLKGILSNIHYIGKVKWNWRKTVPVVTNQTIVKTRPKNKPGEYLVYEGKHMALVSEELFNAAQEKLGKNPRIPKSHELVNAFAGILFCSCGYSMIYRTHSKQGVQKCAPRLLCNNQTYCNTSSCLYEEMIESVCSVLEETIADFKIQIDNNTNIGFSNHYNRILQLEKKLAELDKKEINLWDKYTDEKMPQNVFNDLNTKLKQEREELKEALNYARETYPEPVNYEEKILLFRDAIDALRNPNVSASEKNRLLKACIKRIDYSRNTSVRGANKTTNKPGSSSWIGEPFELDIKLNL